MALWAGPHPSHPAWFQPCSFPHSHAAVALLPRTTGYFVEQQLVAHRSIGGANITGDPIHDTIVARHDEWWPEVRGTPLNWRFQMEGSERNREFA